MLFGADQPQVIGASAIHEAQIIGVIDDTAKHWFDDVATDA
jgi:hypothetical protein